MLQRFMPALSVFELNSVATLPFPFDFLVSSD